MIDLDELVFSLKRGERGELQIRRKTYRGSAEYIDVRHWYPDESTSELRPGKGCTIKIPELAAVVAALAGMDIAARKSKQEERRPRGAPQQRSLDDHADERQARRDMEAF